MERERERESKQKKMREIYTHTIYPTISVQYRVFP